MEKRLFHNMNGGDGCEGHLEGVTAVEISKLKWMRGTYTFSRVYISIKKCINTNPSNLDYGRKMIVYDFVYKMGNSILKL